MFNTTYLNRLRAVEMEDLLRFFPPGVRILEFGSGTGQQARFLSDRGYEVIAIDLPNSDYAAERVFPVQDYDGRHIPLEDESVDVIFSSNVLEHIKDLPKIFSEFRRIQKSGGFGLHLMPTTAWRLWTFITGVVLSIQVTGLLVGEIIKPTRDKSKIRTYSRTIAAGLIPLGHGTSPEGISELWTFSSHAWRREFRKNGFEVLQDKPMGLFYSGNMLFGGNMSLAARARLSRIFGSAIRIYVVRPQPSAA